MALHCLGKYRLVNDLEWVITVIYPICFYDCQNTVLAFDVNIDLILDCFVSIREVILSLFQLFSFSLSSI